MEIIITKDKRDEVSDRFNLLFKDKKYCFFDIETTGLSRKYHEVILIGMLYIEGEKKIVKQYFCDNPREEKLILDNFYKDLQEFDLIISYNGHSFDIPFLNARFAENNLDHFIDPFYGFDLYRLVRKNKNKLPIERTNLKSIENLLGINRQDTISGKESIALYYDYVNYGDLDAKNKVLLHNLDDLKYLLPVVNILDYLCINSIYMEFPCTLESNIIGDLHIENIKKNRDYLYITGKTNFNAEYQSYTSIELSIKDNLFNIRLPLISFTLEDSNKISFLDTSIIDLDLQEIDINLRNSFITSINKDIQYKNVLEYIQRVIDNCIK